MCYTGKCINEDFYGDCKLIHNSYYHIKDCYLNEFPQDNSEVLRNQRKNKLKKIFKND